jgi:hypothetical protein
LDGSGGSVIIGDGMPCILCGSTGDMSAEHVIPDWTRPFLSSPGGKGTHQRTVLSAGGQIEETSYRTGPAATTIKSVCAPCNNGWMSRLEEHTKPLLVPMLEGRRRVYTEREQATVATWAVKTSLVAGSKFVSRIPSQFYTDFFDSRRPLASCLVWMGATPWQQTTSLDYRPIKVWADGMEPDDFNAYGSTLGVGHLALHVLAWRADRPPTQQIEDEFVNRRRLLQIWPQQGRKEWPPRGHRLDLEALDLVADAAASLTR